MSTAKSSPTESARADSPAPTGYVTAAWVLTCAADDRDKTAEKLRDWADEERPAQERSPAHKETLEQLWSEANELRAAAKVLQSHTAPHERRGGNTQEHEH